MPTDIIELSQDKFDQAINESKVFTPFSEAKLFYDDKKALLKSLIDGVDRPILRSFMTDMLNVMVRWVENPNLLCCLIQGVIGLYNSFDPKNYLGLNEVDKENFYNYIEGFNNFIDTLVAFIDLIIVLIAEEAKPFTFAIMDLIKDLMVAVVGAILIAVQQVIFELRDKAIDKIVKWISSHEQNNLWSKCLPFNDFINILKKYVSDYGILAKWFDIVKGHISGLFNKWQNAQKLRLIANVRDIEFLYWLREFLLKLKLAANKFDLCFEFNSSNDDRGNTKSSDESDSRSVPPPNGSPTQGNQNPVPPVSATINSDGTILTEGNPFGANGVIGFTNDSIRNFLNKYYGLPIDIIDQRMSGSSGINDNIIGSNINSNNWSSLGMDCPAAPTFDEFIKWTINLKNKAS